MSDQPTERKYVMAVSPEDYRRTYAMARKSGHRGVLIKGKTTMARFYIRRKVLMADEVKPDGSVLTQEVMDINKVPVNTDYKDSMIEKLRRDFPDKDEDWLKAHADVLDEANRATKRLIMEGIDPGMAGKIIAEALRNQFMDVSGAVAAE